MELKDYVAPIQKWWWLIATATLIAGVTSFLIARQLPPIYQSSAIIQVGNVFQTEQVQGSELGVAYQLTNTYTSIVNGGILEDDTKAALGIDWLPDYEARPDLSAQLIAIAVTDTSPERAQRVATELANQLILLSPTNQQEDQERKTFIDQKLTDLQANITVIEEQIAAKQQEIDQLFSASELAIAEGELATLEARHDTLLTQFADLNSSVGQSSINTLKVLIAAKVPEFPIGPNRMITVVLAAGVGFGLATAAAFLLEFLDDTVKTPEDINKLVEIPTLAGISYIKDDEAPNRLVTLRRPRSHISESFRILRTGVQFSSVDKPNTTLMITSASPGEGKSTVAANLAIVMAQAGYKVLLVDTDLRRPRQHNIFDLSNDRGLTTFLLELDLDAGLEKTNTLLQDYIQATPAKGLKVLTSGPIPPNPSELLGSIKMQVSLATFAASFDFLVLDTTPVLAVTDALVLSTQVDSVLLVAAAGRTRKGQFKQMVERLAKVNANVIGTAMNRLVSGGASFFQFYEYQNVYYVNDEAHSPPRKANGNGQPRKGLSLSWRTKTADTTQEK